MNSLRYLLVLAAVTGGMMHSIAASKKLVHIITQDDFLDKYGEPAKSLKLTKPGNYRLASDISVKPTHRGMSAIVIAGDNIHLDLGGFTLKQGSCTHGAVGIKIKAGHYAISVVNGTIKNFTQLGMIVEGNTQQLCLGEQDSKLIITGCGFGSDYAFTTPAKKPLLQGGIQLGESRAMAQQGYYCYHGALEGVRVTGLRVDHNSPLGMILGVGNDMQFDTCSFSYNFNDRRNGRANPFGNAFGAEFADDGFVVGGVFFIAQEQQGDVLSCGISFTKCAFDGNEVHANEWQSSFGVGANSAWVDLQFRGCSANGNVALTSGEDNATSVSRGYFLEGGIGTLYENCTMRDNKSGNFCRGVTHRAAATDDNELISAVDVTFRHCEVTNNHIENTLGPADIMGLQLAFVDGLSIDTCSINGNDVTTSDINLPAFTRGIRLESGIRQARITGCTIVGTMSTAVGIAYGIEALGDFKNVVIGDCILQNNMVRESFSAGIRVAPFSADEPANVIIHGCTVVGHSIGIDYQTCNGGVCKNNIVADCSLVGVRLLVSECVSVLDNLITKTPLGVSDNSNPSTNFIAQNKVVNADVGYQVTYGFAPFPSKNGNLEEGYPDSPADACDNAFIGKEAPPLSLVTRIMKFFGLA